MVSILKNISLDEQSHNMLKMLKGKGFNFSKECRKVIKERYKELIKGEFNGKANIESNC